MPEVNIIRESICSNITQDTMVRKVSESSESTKTELTATPSTLTSSGTWSLNKPRISISTRRLTRVSLSTVSPTDISKLPEEEDFLRLLLLLEPNTSQPEPRERSDLLVVPVKLSLNESYINLVFYIYYFLNMNFITT